jgi:benzylsuccinate CoA-transferase BbsE subunit
MAVNKGTKSALPPIRILDLTEGGCMLGGKLFSDVGADVIKVEPPGGSVSRMQPFYKNIPDPEKSLFWFAYNTNKRGVTLNLQKPEGRELFKALTVKADIVLESSAAGYMDGIELGYDDISAVNPDIIYASITPFGQTGPKAHYVATDLTSVASSGFLNACGDPDRAPVWIGCPQSSQYAGCEAAIGSMVAYLHRLNTGEGQFVDVSMQEANMSANMNTLQMWDMNKVEFNRVGPYSYVASTGVKQPIYFPCKDGFVMILALGGNPPYVPSSEKLVKWMDEERMAPEWLKKLNWWVDYNASVLTQELADKVGKAITAFTLTKTKDQLYNEGAFERQILVAGVSNTQDITEDIQLRARNFWINIAHPELEGYVPYCGPFTPMTESPMEIKRRAPLIGEHNREIYIHELGLTQKQFAEFRKKGVI